MLLLRETMQVDPTPCNYDDAQSSNHGNTQYSSLTVNTRLSEPKVKECSRVIGERVNRRVEEVWDPELGRHVFRTVEYVEKIVETEVYTEYYVLLYRVYLSMVWLIFSPQSSYFGKRFSWLFFKYLKKF